MTFYQQQFLKIRSECYADEYICQQVMRAKRFIDNHFSDNIDLHTIASEASLSRFHFIRVFKRLYGRTPHQYVISVRIEQAKRLLRANRAVKDVCFAVGFESTSSFTGLFKKATGYTPSDYPHRQQETTITAIFKKHLQP
ncbi:AraC family transcriptional regulator [Spirosoma sp. SC4-14]|uniref:AraC family transcriptional regulator n=1 Tax=Spirosoma sp. SC4-14 TaxID=3128900 RepID=UPI0030D40F89